MRPERLEALLWERVDGTIGVSDLAELEAWLTTNPAARELEAEIAGLAGQMSGVETLPPPAALRGRIETALTAARPPADSAIPHAGVIGRAVPPRRAWALPLAAGLIAGAALVHLLHISTGPPVDGSSASGTMRVQPAVAAAGFEIDLGEGRGTLRADREGALLTTELRLTKHASAEVVVEALDGGLRVTAATHDGESASGLLVGDRKVAVQASGSGRYTLGVAATEPLTVLRLEVRIGSEIVAERWIAAPDAGARP